MLLSRVRQLVDSEKRARKGNVTRGIYILGVVAPKQILKSTKAQRKSWNILERLSQLPDFDRGPRGVDSDFPEPDISFVEQWKFLFDLFFRNNC